MAKKALIILLIILIGALGAALMLFFGVFDAKTAPDTSKEAQISADASPKTHLPAPESAETAPQFAEIEAETPKPENTPEVTPEPTPEIIEATVAAAGDVMMMATQISDAKTAKGYDFSYVFENVAPYLQSADAAAANLETPVAGNDTGFSVSGARREDGTYEKSYFNAPTELLTAMSGAGFDVLCTANNHVLDKDAAGLESTVKNIRAAGMQCVGSNLPDEGRNIAYADAKGIKVAFLAYTTGTNGNSGGYSSEEYAAAVNLINTENMLLDIKTAKESGAEIVCVYAHFGIERQTAVTQEQRNVAHALIDGGADVVFGSHPHWLQETESYEANGKTGYIFYSLGNFTSNMDGDECARSVIAYADLKKDENGARVTGIRYLPVYFYRSEGAYTSLPCISEAYGAIEQSVSETAAETAKAAGERTVNQLGSDAAQPVY